MSLNLSERDRTGYKPYQVKSVWLLVTSPGEDDDHVLALYKINGFWGALAKSNYVNLGFREPVHKNLRELVMTYFEHYASVKQTKALRGYTRPLDASRYTKLNWALDETGANKLYYQYFYGRKAISIITPQMVSYLSPVTDRAYQSETLHTDLNWSFGIRPDH